MKSLKIEFQLTDNTFSGAVNLMRIFLVESGTLRKRSFKILETMSSI